jgi:hypothetical protein
MQVTSSPSTADETESAFDVDSIIEQLTAAKYENIHTLVKLDL